MPSLRCVLGIHDWRILRKTASRRGVKEIYVCKRCQVQKAIYG